MWRRRTSPPPSRTWPPRSGRARVLIEDPDIASQWAVESLLTDAGFDVECCGGPDRLPNGRCTLLTEGSCELAEGADVILNSLSLTRDPSGTVVAALRAAVPTTPVIVATSAPQARHHHDQLEGSRLLTLPASSRRILAEVESALHERGQPQPAHVLPPPADYPQG